MPDLKEALAQAMPEGPWLYPEDEVSDATDRMIAAELTREQIFNQLHQELPYASAIETESWEDREDGSTVIHQQIFVERDSQKAIVIGKGGSRLRTIGEKARAEISEHLGRKVHLFLHVKVNPRWGEDRALYRGHRPGVERLGEHLVDPLGHKLACRSDPAFVEEGAAQARIEVHFQRPGAAVARGLDETRGRIDRA